MTWRVNILASKPAVLGIGLLIGFSLWGQQPDHPATASTAEPGSPPSVSLQPPAPKSPVEMFRNLLLMAPAERREFIAHRPPEAQKTILAKVKEYEGLSLEQRDLRLHVTELRWYLLPLLTNPTNRTELLARVPERLQKLLAARLEEWDKLAPSVQKELLDNEATIRFYFELAARPPAQRALTVTNLEPAAHAQLDSGIRRWQALTDEQRQGVVRHFYQFFDLTAAEKAKALSTLSESERVQLDKTLRTFEGLTPALRAQCLRSFQKFAGLSPGERQEFLKNAERWERMTPAERQSWRNLVSTLSHEPPLPPGLQRPGPPTPPFPFLPNSHRGATSIVTQTN